MINEILRTVRDLGILLVRAKILRDSVAQVVLAHLEYNVLLMYGGLWA